MNLAFSDLLQYGGWAVAAVTGAILGRQQLSMAKFELEISQRLKYIEDTLDLRFDKNERETLLSDSELSERISVNKSKIDSCSQWVKLLNRQVMLVAVKHNVNESLDPDMFKFDNQEEDFDIIDG